MFKRLLISTIISGVIITSGSAFAAHHKRVVSYKDEMQPIVQMSAPMFQPYVGLNYVYLNSNYKSSATDTVGSTTTTFNPSRTAPNNFSGGSMDAGFKWGQYIGMEFGYFQTGSQSKTTKTGSVTTAISELHKGLYTDFMGYLPIQQFDLIGVVGAATNSLGNSTITFGTTTATIRTDDAVVPRLGLGADYHFNKNIGARVIGRYSFTQSSYVNHNFILDAGLFYTFC